jgi:hypothetical protein
MEMHHPLILIDELKLAVLLLALLESFGFRIPGGVGDVLAVGRPGEPIDALLFRRHHVGFTRARIDQVDLPLVLAVRHERQATAVGRPFRLGARLLGECQLPGRAGLRIGQPDLSVICILVPIGLANGVRHESSVRRDFGRARSFE